MDLEFLDFLDSIDLEVTVEQAGPEFDDDVESVEVPDSGDPVSRSK